MCIFRNHFECGRTWNWRGRDLRLLQNCLARYLIQLTESRVAEQRERERERTQEYEAENYRNQLTHTELLARYCH